MPDIDIKYKIKIKIWTDEILTVGNHWTVGNSFPIKGVNEIDDIVSGSLKLSKFLCSDGIRFGEACSDKFEADIYSNAPSAANGLNIEVYAVYDETGVEIRLFKGKVDELKKTNRYSDETHIVAYDLMYFIGETDVTEWWNAYVETNAPFTFLQGFNALIGYMGIEMFGTLTEYANAHPEVASILNFVIYKPIKLVDTWYEDDTLRTVRTRVIAKKLTFRALLSMFCECMLCFPKFDENGKLKLIFLEKILENLPELSLEDVDDSNSNSKGFLTDEVDGIKIIGIGGTGERLFGSQQPMNPYVISNNAVLSSMSKYEFSMNIDRANQLTALMQRIMEFFRNNQYTPMSTALVVGSILQSYGGQYRWDEQNSYILRVEQSGSLLIDTTLSAGGEQKQTDKSPYVAEFEDEAV